MDVIKLAEAYQTGRGGGGTGTEEYVLQSTAMGWDFERGKEERDDTGVGETAKLREDEFTVCFTESEESSQHFRLCQSTETARVSDRLDC